MKTERFQMSCLANVILRIMGDDFDPDIISEELSVEATEKWRKGQKSVRYNTFKKYDCWLYATGYKRVTDINELLTYIYLLFNEKKEKIRITAEKFQLSISLDIVIKMSDEELPALYFEKRIINFLYHIGAEIDIDMYLTENK